MELTSSVNRKSLRKNSEVVRGVKMNVRQHWTEGVCTVVATAAAAAIKY